MSLSFSFAGIKMQNYTFIFLFLDSTESEASVTDAYDLDGSSAGVKSVVNEEEKTGASQQYDPLTTPSLPGIPGNILFQFLAFVLFCFIGVSGTLVLLSILHFRATCICKGNDSQCCWPSLEWYTRACWWSVDTSDFTTISFSVLFSWS